MQVLQNESTNIETALSDMSGLEITSPHKVTNMVQKFPRTVEGVGEIRTSWIGQRGVILL